MSNRLLTSRTEYVVFGQYRIGWDVSRRRFRLGEIARTGQPEARNSGELAQSMRRMAPLSMSVGTPLYYSEVLCN